MPAICNGNEHKLKRGSKYLHMKLISLGTTVLGRKHNAKLAGNRFLMLIALLTIPRSWQYHVPGFSYNVSTFCLSE